MADSNSLEGKTMTGLFWSFTDLLVKHGLQFIIQIILARLLMPEHFGLIGMILVFMAISDAIVDGGFSQALIRHKDTSQEDYSTVFYFNFTVALLLYGLLYILARPISTFFEEPQLVTIIRVLFLVLIISSLGIIQKVMLVKSVDFKTIAKVNVVAAITSGGITIAVAMLGYGVWSLVINLLSAQFMQTLLFWLFNRWVPSMKFKKQSFKKFFGFGSKLLVSGLIDTFYNNLYYLIIGRLYSTTQLGFYTTAVKFRDLAAFAITATVQRVSYPVLSSIQDDGERLKSGFRKIIKMTAFINFPLMLGLAAVATPLFSLFLGDKWLPSVLYFQLLCFAGMLFPIHLANLNILQVKGRSDLFLLIEIIKKVLLTILILLSFLFKLGILGLIGTAVLNSYISLFINTYFSAKEIAYSGKEQLKDLVPLFLLSIIMGVIVSFFGMIVPNHNLLKLIIQIGIGFVVYTVGCKVARIQELSTTYHMLLTLILKGKHLLHKR